MCIAPTRPIVPPQGRCACASLQTRPSCHQEAGASCASLRTGPSCHRGAECGVSVLPRFACLLTAFSKKCSARGPSISSKKPSSLYGADAPLQGRVSNQGRPSPARESKGRHTLIKSLLPWLTPEPLDPFCFDSGERCFDSRAGIYVYTGEVRKTVSEGRRMGIWD